MREGANRAAMLLVVLVMLLVTVLWWLFVFSPKQDGIASAEIEYDNALLQESQLQTRIAELQSIRDNELSYLFAIGQMESSIPASPQADAFIEDITFLAESTGVTVSSITLNPPTTDITTGGFEISISLSLEGEYFEILGFLYGVEALDRLVRVDAIGLTPIQVVEEVEEAPPDEGEGADPAPDEGEGADPVTEPRVRPNPDLLAAEITMRMFTRSPAAGSGDTVGEVPQGSAEIDDPGSGDNI